MQIPRSPAHFAAPTRRLSLLVLLAMVAVGVVVPPAQASRAPAELATSSASAEAEAPLATTVAWSKGGYKRGNKAWTNRVRTDRGLRALTVQSCLDRRAEQWAYRLAARDNFSHQDLGDVLRDCNLSGVSENLALGYKTSRSTIRAWMNSSGHRSNLLDSRNRKMGVGIYKGPRGYVVVQLMGW